jgi:hypothetical protein
MISAAKTFLTKAKEMDQSLVVCPWFKNSILPNLKSLASIPETMGAFKQHFHQAQPKVAGGFLHMRLWLGHDKDPKLLDDDLRWWLKECGFARFFLVQDFFMIAEMVWCVCVCFHFGGLCTLSQCSFVTHSCVLSVRGRPCGHPSFCKTWLISLGDGEGL